MNVHGDVRSLLLSFFSSSDASLRQISQCLHRLGLVTVSLNRRRYSALLTGVALIIRTVDVALYTQFGRGSVSDAFLVDKVFEIGGVSATQREDRHNRYGFSMFEAIVAIAAKEIAREARDTNEPISSSLIERHRTVCAEDKSREHIRKSSLNYSSRVVDNVDRLWRELDWYSDFGFLECVRRIELLVNDRDPSE